MKTNGLHTTPVGDAHAYTRSDSPWILQSNQVAEHGRLMHFLSGGGMRAFGRTVKQEETRRRHRRFWIGAAAFAAVWLAFFIF